VLVSGPNFGCGSSREHAPWALRDYGFKAVIAPSFADIFRNNLPNVGLVPVTLDSESTRRILKATTTDPQAQVSVDVQSLTVTCEAAGVEAARFELDSNAQYRLVEGKDLIDLALDLEDAIVAHEQGRPSWMPSTTGVIEDVFEQPWVE
jgi:3-isopropylmalate/(R)-2-methylmalate dehydratase small subunit